MCQHVEFLFIGIRYTFVGIPDSVLRRIFYLLILRRKSIYDVAYLPRSMDLPSVFKIDKIQDQSVSTTYLTVCLYSH